MVDTLEAEVRLGVILHREIDRFTDTHEVVRQSKRRLQPKYRHYAGVIVDMYYDHYLSANWSKYTSQGLKSFTTSFYQRIASYDGAIPEKCTHLLRHMSAGDWLYHYQYLEGLQQALTGMSRRTSFDSHMEHAVEDLRSDYQAFKAEFELFFPQVVAHGSKFPKLAGMKAILFVGLGGFMGSICRYGVGLWCLSSFPPPYLWARSA